MASRIRFDAELEGAAAEEVTAPRQQADPRNVYLKADDFKRYGWTEDCEACRRMRIGKCLRGRHGDKYRTGIEMQL